MDTVAKLNLLSEDSQYDLACACGTAKNDRRTRGGDGKWLYPVPLSRGGYGIMLKTLLTNNCANDCKYCPLRSDTNVQRCSLTPDETAAVFMQYLRKKQLIGMFLSSGVIGTPDRTMEKLTAAAEILRRKYQYRGYIHLKIIPGASRAAIEQALSLANAVSLNVETPGRRHFTRLSVCKDFDRDIVSPLKFMAEQTGKGRKFARVKCTTQFIVGASDESDLEIIKYLDGIYNRLNFQRVYFSAYQPGLGSPDIPGERKFELNPEERFTREHRLYQTDFLIRQYGFQSGELIFQDDGNLSLDMDPKEMWAVRHPEYFPVNINTAAKEQLLRVPGLGPITVNRILKLRKIHRLHSLVDIGVKGKLSEKASSYTIFQ
ncbi:MAG: helix-hairpin-helix domain-containing protein [Victivallaceae bacterium]|nr:helix-hairpin-helix domain-containing protein [Victivallaceae bacterium]